MALSPKASLKTGKRTNQKRGWELHSSSFDVTTGFVHADATLTHCCSGSLLHLYSNPQWQWTLLVPCCRLLPLIESQSRAQSQEAGHILVSTLLLLQYSSCKQLVRRGTGQYKSFHTFPDRSSISGTAIIQTLVLRRLASYVQWQAEAQRGVYSGAMVAVFPTPTRVLQRSGMCCRLTGKRNW